MLLWLLLAAFVVWQLLLVTWTFNQASNAARTASRVDGRGGDAEKAGAQRALARPAQARRDPVRRREGHRERAASRSSCRASDLDDAWRHRAARRCPG